MVVQRGLCEERDHPWDPSGVQEGVGRPSLDQLQGGSFVHQDQTLCAQVHQAHGCFLCMSHLPSLQGERVLGGDPEDGEGQVGESQEEAKGPELLEEVEVSCTLDLLVLGTCSLEVLRALVAQGVLVGAPCDLSPM